MSFVLINQANKQVYVKNEKKGPQKYKTFAVAKAIATIFNNKLGKQVYAAFAEAEVAKKPAKKVVKKVVKNAE